MRIRSKQPGLLITAVSLVLCISVSSLSAQTSCSPGESVVTLYTTYANDYSSSWVGNPQNVLSYPDNRHARLNASTNVNQRGDLIIEFPDVVAQGDTVWFRTASDVAFSSSLYRVSSSFNGVSFADVVDYSTPTPGQIYREDFYVVANATGIQYMRFQSIDNGIRTWVESVWYDRMDCYTYCGFETINYTEGSGDTTHTGTTADSAWLAMGLPDGNFAELNGDDDDAIILDLTDTIPYGAYIQVYLSRDTTAPPIQISGSANGSTFEMPVTIYPDFENPVHTPYFYEVQQVSGVRYLKFTVLLDNTTGYVDGVNYIFPDLFGRNVVSGYVYDDANSNGIKNAGESGAAGIDLDLYLDVNADSALTAVDQLIASTTTAAGGGYIFETYSLETDYLVVVDPQTLPDSTMLTMNYVQPLVFSQFNEGACLDLSYEYCTGNCPAEAYDDYDTTTMNTAVIVNVLDNDRGDLDTTSVSVTGLLQPAHGSLSVGTGGHITYTPDGNYAGPDQFEYQVCADWAPFGCDTATVYIEVGCQLISFQNTVYGVIFDDQDQDGSFDAGETWTYADTLTMEIYADSNGNGVIDAADTLVTTALTNGSGNYQFNLANAAGDYVVQVDTASIPAGAAFTSSLSYAVSFSGTDEASCGNNTGFAFCAPNCAIIAVDDAASVDEGTSLYLNVIANDIDFDDDIDAASLDLVTKPTNGNVLIGNDGQFIYVPNGTFVGTDVFDYVICDQQSPTPSCDTATVTISVISNFTNPCSEAARTHTFYVPYPENELRDALINASSFTCGGYIDDVARSVITFKCPYPGTEITFDHWEDGYESDITSPGQSSTEVWGDGDLNNGVVPGYPDDIIPSGGNIVLDNNVVFNPRDPNTIAYDGKDKIYTSGDIALSRIVGDLAQFHVQAAKTDVYDINRFGTNFTVPFGENLGDEFQYTALFIRAGEAGAQVSVDTDNDGLVEEFEVLGEGEVLFVDGGVQGGATITSDEPVGVDVLFGGLDCYGTRQISILPGEFYSHTYYTPVPTTVGTAPAAVYFYNSLESSMTINWFSSYNSGSFSVSSKSTYRFELSDDSGYKFVNPSGESYTAMEVVDSDGDGDDYDWAFNLISAARLTDFASIAWGPGSRDGSDNYNPLWVTPTAATTIYIKYDGNMVDEDATESPCGIPYDKAVSMGELEYFRIFDDSDNDQSGIGVYTCDGTPIVAVYGEDPEAGNPTPTASPALDVGTTVQPMCLQALILATNDRAVSPPDDFVVIDILDNDYGFLTEVDTTSVSTLGLLQPSNGTVLVNGNGSVTYTPDPGWEGVDTFEYSVCATTDPTLCDVATVIVTVSPCVATASENLLNGYVYLELLPDDGIYFDEDRMAGFLVNLIADVDCDGVVDAGERTIETTTSNASGAFSFSTINGQYAADDFDEDAGLGSGDDGSISWDNDWQEVGESNGWNSSPLYIGIDPVAGDTALVLNGSNNSATRDITFTDGMLQVTLRFNYRRQSMEDNGEGLQVRINGSTIYNIGDGDGIGNDAYPVDVELEIPINLIDETGTNTLEFLTNGYVSDYDYFFIDDVEFIFVTESVCFITEVDVSDKNNAYLPATLNSDTASFSSLGNCANDLYLGVIANVVAYDDYGVGSIDNPVEVDVLVNDIGETDPLSVTNSGWLAPSNGSVNVNLDGSITYTPDPGFSGVDSFEYEVFSSEDPMVSDVAMVYIEISCIVVEGSNSLAGSVFNDKNENGIYDVGESLVPGIDFYLYEDENGNGIIDGSEGDAALDTILNSSGNYTFIIEAPEQQTTLSIPVILGVDDAEQYYWGNVSRYSSDLDNSNYYPYIGMRFQDVDIPQGAVVTSARLKFYANNSRSSGGNFRISAEDDDLPPAFSSDYYDVSSRWDATSTVDWFNVEAWTAGQEYYTPDISSLVQNLVNRGDWNPGDNMAFIIRWLSGNQRNPRAYDYNGSGQYAPVLEITYGENSYPINYIVMMDPATLPAGGYLTTDSGYTEVFELPDESTCERNFGVALNTTLAVDDINTTLQNTAVSGDVLTNDYDKEGNAIDFNSFLAQGGSGLPIASGATLSGTNETGDPVADAGTITFDGDGNYTFTPESAFIGEVNVPYAMCDDGTVPVCDTATLTITVTPFTNPNLPSTNSITISDDNVVHFGSAERRGNVLINDSDPELDDMSMQEYSYDSDGDGIPDTEGTFSSPTFVGGVNRYGNPTNKAGSFTLYEDGFYEFTPEPGFYGTVTIEYEVCDDFSPPACARASLTIEVVEPTAAMSNLPPFAGDDYASTPINHPVTSNWIGNDGDADGDYIDLAGTGVYIDPYNLGTGDSIATHTTAQGGTLTFYDDGNFTYVPPLHYVGPDRLPYRICDSTELTVLCDSATIYLNVTPIRFDYGDLGPGYESARHMIPLDEELDGVPDLAGSIWLGAIVDAEVEAKKSALADGDDLDFSNDEEGVTFPAQITPGEDATFKIVVNGIDPGMTVHYGIWIDWDIDGTFDDFYKGFGMTQDENGRNRDTIDQIITVPAVLPSTMVFFRARAFQSEPASVDYGVAMRSGEAEDYRWDISSLLPVELIYFEAEAEGDDAMLSWATASELNNDFFSVQRSTDAVNWTEIGIVEGHGTTSEPHTYGLTDPDLLSGLYYYRLQQFDFDGSYEYSDIQSVKIETNAPPASRKMSVYPNPVHAQSPVRIKGLPQAPASLIFVMPDGSHAREILLDDITSLIDLSALRLQTGLYLVIVEQKGKRYYDKLYIQE